VFNGTSRSEMAKRGKRDSAMSGSRREAPAPRKAWPIIRTKRLPKPPPRAAAGGAARALPRSAARGPVPRGQSVRRVSLEPPRWVLVSARPANSDTEPLTVLKWPRSEPAFSITYRGTLDKQSDVVLPDAEVRVRRTRDTSGCARIPPSERAGEILGGSGRICRDQYPA
jgi:hypothetical protein